MLIILSACIPSNGKQAAKQAIELADNHPEINLFVRSIDFTLQKVPVKKRTFAVLKRKKDLEDKRQLPLIEAVDLLENRTQCFIRKGAIADGTLLDGGAVIAIELNC